MSKQFVESKHCPNNRGAFFKIAIRLAVLTGAWSLCCSAGPIALTISGMVTGSNMSGAAVGAGDYTLQQLADAGAAVGSVNLNGLTGVPIWSLLGGNAAGSSDVVTSTPAGDNPKNAILRSYLLATNAAGQTSIISLGEIDPFFGGTGSVPVFVAFSGTDGQPELVFPGTGASGRDVIDLASIQVLAGPAAPMGAGGVSTSLTLTGNVANPGTYTVQSLQSLPSSTVGISGDNYTGVPILTFLNPTSTDVKNQYVLVTGTDGYETLYSLAELDPAFGAPSDLIAYADTQGQFPGDGFARTVIPGDNHAGRYVSNLNAIAVGSVPEPGTGTLVSVVLLILYLSRKQPGRRALRNSLETRRQSQMSLADYDVM